MGARPKRDRAYTATYEAAPNIALVKYWGVRDEALALPYNSSISVTLDRLRSRTTVRFDPDLSEDRFTLNGTIASGGPLDGVHRFLDRVRMMAGLAWRADVVSANNFQTASGLASSASGFAALAGAATHAAGLTLGTRELSGLARFGSGSASRSILGGFVEWQRGERADGTDCYAKSLHGPEHWPELVDLVALIRDAPTKAIRSSRAMQSTVATSPEFARRQEELPGRIAAIRAAIGDRDEGRLFPLVIEECDSFRSVCETTVPTLDYLTDASRAVLALVHAENRAAGRPIAAYTHDAGAHVHVFTLTPHARRLARRLRAVDGVERVLTLHPGKGGRLLSTR